jgi:hypothetical protein
MANAPDEGCVEIVLRATPDPEALRSLLTSVAEKLAPGLKEDLQSSSATYMRLVVEPTTLQFYESDMRRYEYWTTKGPKFDHPVIEYERTHAIGGPITRTE